MYGMVVRSAFRSSGHLHGNKATGVRRLFSIPCRHTSMLESAARDFRPTSFPWLAVIPDGHEPYKDDELSFISHAGNGRKYKRPMPCRNINLDHERMFSSNKDGWMMFVHENGMPIIFNPVTGSHLQHLPSLYTLLNHQRRINACEHLNFVVFLLADNLVAFADCLIYGGYHILAAATPGDDALSFIHLPSSYHRISSIVFHEADRKFYALRHYGDMQSFRLNRCGRKTVFCEVSSILAKATERDEEFIFSDSHLVSDGTNLLRVKKRKNDSLYLIPTQRQRYPSLVGENQDSSHLTSKEFEILKYCPDADMWVQVIDMDYLGNNSLFFDQYGARLLPLSLSGGSEEEGRPRRNCIYFTDHKSDYCRCYVKIYDVGEGTVETCFSTNIQSEYDSLPALMWFTPSLSAKN